MSKLASKKINNDNSLKKDNKFAILCMDDDDNDNNVSNVKKIIEENTNDGFEIVNKSKKIKKKSNAQQSITEPVKNKEVTKSKESVKNIELIVDKSIEENNEVSYFGNTSDNKKITPINQNNDWSFNQNRSKPAKVMKDTKNEHTELYIENLELNDELGNNLFLYSQWTVWVHKSDCIVWTEDSYTNIYLINSWGSFWRFFNNFYLLDKSKNQFFIMRNKIKPIWEDNENRNGGICSIKIDSYGHNTYSGDLGSDVMTCISLLVMNETFLQNNEEINGISYTVKNKSILIKLWCKNFNDKIVNKLPFVFFNKLDQLLKTTFNDNVRTSYTHSTNQHYKKNDKKLSIRYTKIEPEYEVVI